MNANTYGYNLLTLQDGERHIDVRAVKLWTVREDMGGEYECVAHRCVSGGEGLTVARYRSRSLAKHALKSLMVALVDCNSVGFRWPSNVEDTEAWAQEESQ